MTSHSWNVRVRPLPDDHPIIEVVTGTSASIYIAVANASIAAATFSAKADNWLCGAV